MHPNSVEPQELAPAGELPEGIRCGSLEGDRGTVFCVQPEAGLSDLAQWAGHHTPWIGAQLLRHGAILFRGFPVDRGDGFGSIVSAISPHWAEYREPATPRTPVGGHIYTSTEYPQEQDIPLHNENSHCTSWPRRIYFHCVTPATSGGQTPIADCRRVLARIPADIVARFKQRHWRYVRNFGSGLGFSWQKVFGTQSRQEVERYCEENSMDCRWGRDDSLRVTYIRQAVRIHPATSEEIWFNHGLFFNPASMEATLREMLLESFSLDEIPYNTLYGDGEPVEPEVLSAISAAYASETCYFSWQTGDVLMADNMLIAHGRKAYSGARRILVAMTDAVSA